MLRSSLLNIRASERSDQVDSDGSNHSKILNSENLVTVAKALLQFAVTNFLPIAFVSEVALGIANPALGCLAHKYSLSKFSTFGIFLISGLQLLGRETKAFMEAWPAGIFGLV